MVRVLATGTFELLHPGHLLFLEEAKKLGDELIVIVARDSTVKKRKRVPIIPETQRVQMVAALKMVDQALLGSERDIYEPLYRIRPDIVAIGYDQDFNEEQLEHELRARGFQAKVIRIKARNSHACCKAEEIIRQIVKSVEGGTWVKNGG